MPLNGFFDTDRDIILMKLVLVFVIFCCGFCPKVNGHESKKIDLVLPDLMDISHLLNRNDIYGKYAWNIIKKTI